MVLGDENSKACPLHLCRFDNSGVRHAISFGFIDLAGTLASLVWRSVHRFAPRCLFSSVFSSVSSFDTVTTHAIKLFYQRQYLSSIVLTLYADTEFTLPGLCAIRVVISCAPVFFLFPAPTTPEDAGPVVVKCANEGITMRTAVFLGR